MTPKAFVTFLMVLGASLGAQAQLSLSEIEKRLDKNALALERAPLFNVPQEVTDQMIATNKAKYPNFKPSFWYYHYVKYDGWMYAISYDWTGNECNLFTFNISTLEKRGKELNDFVENPDRGASGLKKERLKLRYCETLFNFYAPESK